MSKLTYADWLYEYERCYDLLATQGISFYGRFMELLEIYYPEYYERWQNEVE